MTESINSALQSVGNSSATKSATNLANLGSIGYGLYNNYQNQAYQNQLRSYAQDPSKMNAYASKFTKPLTAGLNSAVGNNTQAYLAQRGLSESPQIAAQVQSQAIAPYVQENQKTGYSDALQALNLGGGAANTGAQAANGVSSLAKAFSSLGGANNGSAALKQLLQLVNSGSTPQTTDTPGQALPTEQTQTWQPDYTAEMYTPGGAGGGSED
jgi:hypothetical protein